MAQVAIFETEHFEGAYPVIRLFDNGQNQITIFCWQQSYRQFQYLFKDDAHRFRWVVKDDNESKYRFIYRMYKEVRRSNIRLFYLNTISNNHIFYTLMIRLLPKVRAVVTLHDINGYFHFKFSFSIRRWIRYIGKRSLIRAVKEFNVVSATMVPYLQSKLPAWKKVYNVPGAVFERMPAECLSPAETGTINMVVPGTIDGRRRNYETVFELLQQCNEAGLPVSVTLLGSHYGDYGKMILERCRAYSASHNNLFFYENSSVVDQPEFDRVMNNAHVVFTPSVIDTIIFDGVTETYGLSISSGNLFDVIKHAKPFIIPEALKMPDNMESSCFHYKTAADIFLMLQRILNEPSFYNELSQKALNNSREYTISKVRERNALLFE
jgi:hypothetical protein